MPVVKQKQYQPETKQKESNMKTKKAKPMHKMPDGKMMAGAKHGTSVAKKGAKKVSKKMY
jgi:hypothetical protein